MYLKKKTIGLILGGGKLTNALINNCKKKKIKICIIAIEDNYNLYKIKPDIKIRLDRLGSIFSYLKKKNICQVILLGSVKKKNIWSMRPNFITFFYLLKMFFLYKNRDGKLLDKVIKIFENKNINIIDPRSLLKNNICNNKYNNLIKFKKYLNIKTIKDYYNLAKKFGESDKGQAVIISDGKIVSREDHNGTDFLIRNFKLSKKYGFSCLVKIVKPKQDIRVDLPTIGPKTIKNLINAGINGIIVENKKTFIESPSLTFDLINKNNIFFYAL
ncbi:MAG: DUF1009 domain-containing protein [Alphaproteobacteria bacterium TMED93]|nr:MAG: DUF1009 domain-containing protein [Alphaproteobacteria bacterium TMED93]